MISDRLALGIDLSYQNVNDIVSVTELGPFVRYYLNQAHTSWFLQAQAGPAITSIENFFTGGRETQSFFNLFVGGGLNKFLSSNIAVDIQLGVDITSGDDLPENFTSIAGSVGMQYGFW